MEVPGEKDGIATFAIGIRFFMASADPVVQKNRLPDCERSTDYGTQSHVQEVPHLSLCFRGIQEYY